MKNKTKTYILLTLVLFIWGIIGYKILSAVNPSTPKTVEQHFNTTFNPKTNTKQDTFSIQLSDRDPFLGTLYIKKKPKQKTVQLEAPIVWLPIEYHGNVSNQNNKTKVFIISIDHQQYLMHLGQEIKEVKLIKGNSSSVIMRYKGVRKTIPKT